MSNCTGLPCSPTCQSPVVDINEVIPSYNHMRVRQMSFGAGMVWLGDENMLLEHKATF